MNGEIRVYYINISAIIESGIKHSNATKMIKEKLLPVIIYNSFNINKQDYIIRLTEKGKPHIVHKDNLPAFFSISHSKKFWVCATSTNEIGIDIEYIKKGKMSIAEYYYTSEENEILKDEKAFDRNFYKIWTAKEAYSKLIGNGISSELLRNFTMLNNTITKNGELLGYLSEVNIADGYVCTIATHKPSPIIRIEELEFNF